MTTLEIIEKLSDSYDAFDPDLLKRIAWERQEGDTLALFICREIKDVVDPGASVKNQMKEVVRAMDTAIAQLVAVRDRAKEEI